MSSKITKQFLPFITAFLLFCGMRPYFVWGFYYLPLMKFVILLAISLLFYSKRKMLYSRKDVLLSIIFVFTVVFGAIISSIGGSANFFGILNILSNVFLVFIILSSKEFRGDVLKSFSTIYSVLIAASFISWMLLKVGILPEIGLLTSHDMEDRWFIHYPFLVIESSLGTLVRFNGLFDEPGVVGTVGAILLCINGFNLKDWRNIVILITCLFSLSFFFYLISLTYLIIYFIFVKRKVIIVVLLATIVVTFYEKTKDDDIFITTLWERVVWDSDRHQFKGDNRINDDAVIIFESKKGTLEYFFGFDDKVRYNKFAEGSSSYKTIIANYGIIFFTLYSGFFILLAYRKEVNKIAFLLYCLVLLANLYQRPSIYVPHILFLFIVFADNLRKDSYFTQS